MNTPKPKRRWLQFRLRTLLMLVTLCAIPCSWLAVKIQQAKREEAAAAAIWKSGGSVTWDTSFSGPAWIRFILGEHFFSHVIRVLLAGESVDDSTLERLQVLDQIQELQLVNTKVTDAGLEHLKRLRDLKSLTLSYSKVTDAGLNTIADLKQLEILSFESTDVTDLGLEKLSALKQLQVLWLYSTNVTDTTLEHLQRMKQLNRLYLINTQVTEVGLGKFHLAVLNCEIDRSP